MEDEVEVEEEPVILEDVPITQKDRLLNRIQLGSCKYNKPYGSLTIHNKQLHVQNFAQGIIFAVVKR